jgi:hypothetical protein
VWRIGFLGLAPEFSGVEALRAGLRDLGYIEGSNLIIEWRWAENVEQLPTLAADLVARRVDVIIAPSSTFVQVGPNDCDLVGRGWHSLQREHRGQRLLFDTSRFEHRHLERADGKTHNFVPR